MRCFQRLLMRESSLTLTPSFMMTSPTCGKAFCEFSVQKVVSSRIIHYCCQNFLNHSSQHVLSTPDHGDGGGGECVQCAGGAAQLRSPWRGPQCRRHPHERDEDEEPLRWRPHRFSQAENNNNQRAQYYLTSDVMSGGFLQSSKTSFTSPTRTFSMPCLGFPHGK